MSITPIDDFYESLPVFDEFAGITEEGQYRPLPEDWHVVVTDVERSTAAIARGGYKQVNIVGAASIVAVLNAVRPRQVPFVFGGDGALLAVPEAVLGPVRQALIATRRMALREFGLTLRVGMVPVREIHAAGHRALVARYRVSAQYAQAVFSGGGVTAAELMTCLIFKRQGEHVHFGDGAEGGYALAAQQMKEQLAALARQEDGGRMAN
jgi:hypothetical protein